jgi:hypothetical protein
MLPQPTDVAHRRNGRQHPTRTVRVGRGPLSVFFAGDPQRGYG